MSSALAADRLAVLLRTSMERTTAYLARSAVAFVKQEAWTAFGFARLDDHARERFNRSGRWIRDLAALGRGFDSLPGLEAALSGSDGQSPVGQVAALLIARTASAESVGAWLGLARRATVRQFKAEIRLARAAGSSWPPTAEDESRPRPAGSDSPAEDGRPGPDDDDVSERLRVRLPAPRAVRAAFDEAFELYRAVEGRQAGVTSFVDSLVAEACAGPYPPDMSCSADSGASREDAREELLARSTQNWRALSAVGLVERWPGSAPEDPGQIERDETDRDDPDGRIRRLLALHDRLERRLGRVLAEMGEIGAWRSLRFDGLGHYAEQRLGLARTTARDRARVTRRLTRLPVVREAYDNGRIGFTAALSVVRILGKESADENLQVEWVERAARATVKRLQDEAAALGRWQVDGCFPRGRGTDATAVAGGRMGWVNGCSPRGREAAAAAVDGGPSRWVDGCFPGSQVSRSSEVTAAARGGIPTAEQSAATAGRLGPLSDAEWHGSLRRDAGMARRRIRDLGWKAAWEAAWRFTAGHGGTSSGGPAQPIELKSGRSGWCERGLLSPRRSDSRGLVLLSLTLPEELAGAFLSAVESAREGLAERVRERLHQESSGMPAEIRGRSRGDGSGETDDRPSLAAARLFHANGLMVPPWVGLLALIEDFVDTWDVVQNRRRPSEDAVHIRDGFRCMAPGCTSRRNLQGHHVIYRSQGGTDDLENRVCLCAFHHQRGEHGGLASCRGEAPLGIRWSLGKGGRGGSFRNEIRVNR